MHFNSHVDRLLDVSVRLVNGLTPGSDGGHLVESPEGAALRRVVAEAVAGEGYTPRPTRVEVESLRAEVLRVREVFEALDGDRPDDAAGLVNAMLRRTQAHPELDRDDDGGWAIHFHGPDTSFDRGWAAGLAAGLAMAIGGDLGSRLGVCRAPGCDRVWVDRSRNTHRRFCSTRCQNRVKAAAHRVRTRRR